MRTLPAKYTLSMPDVDRALVIATLGLFTALALRAIADPQTATTPVAPPVGYVQFAISPHSGALVADGIRKMHHSGSRKVHHPEAVENV